MDPANVMIPTPRVGDVVSFTYETQARKEAPVAPAITRVRTDVAWEDLTSGAQETCISYFFFFCY